MNGCSRGKMNYSHFFCPIILSQILKLIILIQKYFDLACSNNKSARFSELCALTRVQI